MLPRGIRNNNPLNIRRSKDQWKGLKAQQQDASFCQFKLNHWNTDGVQRSTYSPERTTTSIGGLPSVRLSANGRRPARTTPRPTSRT